jgi:hypothetical protein
MSLTLAEELLLLVLDDESGKPRLDSSTLGFALAGGWLLELALAGRVDVVDKRLRVLDPSPLGDPDLDGALARIERDKPRKPKDWLGKLAKDARRCAEERLVAGGQVRREERRVLGLVPVRRLPAGDPAAELEAYGRLRAAVLEGPAGRRPDERTAALAALVHGCKLGPKVFPDLDKKAVNARLAEIAAGDWAGEAIRKAVQEVEAAVMAAVLAASTAATTASSSS